MKFCNKNSQRCQPRSSLFNRMEQQSGVLKATLHGLDIFRCIQVKDIELLEMEEAPKVQSPLDNGLEPEIDYKKLYEELLAKQTTTTAIIEEKQLEQELNNIIDNKSDKEEKTYIYVPFEYKDDAKKDGAKFNKNKQKWFVYKSNPKYEWCIDLWNNNNFTYSSSGNQLINSRYDDLVRKHKK